MTNPQPRLPQPELERAGITFEQYEEFTPEKLELWDGYLGYGSQNQLGFHLAILRNMGLLTAVHKFSSCSKLRSYYADAGLLVQMTAENL